MKRAFELLLVILASPVWLPLMVIVALLTFAFHGRPVLFTQDRGGLGGRVFQLYKFRSMTNARGPDGELLSDERRLTRFGKFLRSSSLDELPSLLNFFRGDIALVGPRPFIADYLNYYSPEQARRHEVRPGITGWAQVMGRNSLTWDRRLELDVWYVDNRSLPLDMKIMLLTILKVLKREGISEANGVTMSRFRGPGS